MVITVVYGKQENAVKLTAETLAKGSAAELIDTKNIHLISAIRECKNEKIVIADYSGMLSLDIWFFKNALDKAATVLYVGAEGGWAFPAPKKKKKA